MDIAGIPPTIKGPAETFTGDVWRTQLTPSEFGAQVNLVRFAPGARSAWHQHASGQVLHVVEGRGLTQARGGDVIEMGPGDSVHSPSGEWHWHGAAPDAFMAHLSITVSPAPGESGNGTEWGAHVTNEEYPSAEH